MFWAPPWVRLSRETVELPSGRVVDDFYRIVLPDYVAVAAVTPEKQYVIVRAYKHGVGRITLSPPGGLVNAGESPLHAAQRELLEETGYSTSKWVPLGTFVVDGNRQCGTAHLFLARDVQQTVQPVVDDTEELQTELVCRSRLIEAIRKGEISLLGSVSAMVLAMVLGSDEETREEC